MTIFVQNNEKVKTMDNIRYKNVNYISIVFQILAMFTWVLVIYCLYIHNTKPILMLSVAGFLLFSCTFSLLGEKNDMTEGTYY